MQTHISSDWKVDPETGLMIVARSIDEPSEFFTLANFRPEFAADKVAAFARAKANCKLAAMAPDLLKVLRAAVSDDPSNWRQIAQEVISRATKG